MREKYMITFENFVIVLEAVSMTAALALCSYTLMVIL